MKIAKRRFRAVLLLITVGLSGVALHAQSTDAAKPQQLSVDKPVSGTLSKGGRSVYSLSLKENYFVYGEVNQISVDVVVKVKDPAGAVINEYDGPGEGPEPFQFTTDKKGPYLIEVVPFEDNTGDFSIVIKAAEPVAVEPERRVEQLLMPLTGEGRPGAAAAVYKEGKVIFNRAWGEANLTYGIPFTTETRNNIGSTSKQFTAFAICLLAKDGELSLDDDVRKHIPELPDLGRTITLRHLLGHTSGYREFINLLIMGGLNIGEGDYVSREEIIEIVQRQPELQNDPGAEFNYNNTGFGLLAVVIERISGEPFAQWMKANVFLPLGMEHTVVREYPRQVVPNSSTGYTAGSSGGVDEGRDIGASTGAGGIYATTGDLMKWLDNMRTGALGGKELISWMTTPDTLTNGESSGYGLGLFIDTFRGLDRIHHGGADMAHRSYLAYFPEAEMGITVQSNYSRFPGSVADEIAEIYLGDYIEAAKSSEPDAVSKPFDPADFDSKTFDAYAGRYELEAAPGFVLKFFREENTYYIQATGQSRAEIVPTSDSTFALTIVDASVTFHRNAEGAVDVLTLHQNGNNRAKRLKDAPYSPGPEELEAYTGRFFSEELETFYSFVVRDSALVAQHRRMPDITLKPVEEDKFSGNTIIGNLDFMRNDAGEVTGFTAGNGRTKDVEFVKFQNLNE